MREVVEKTPQVHGADLDRKVEAAREAHLHKYLAEADEMLTAQLADKYHHLVPPNRIEAMLSMPTRFEDRDTFDRALVEANGKPDSDERVLGYSRFDLEPAHVAMDHLEIPKTIAHERLHQLSDPTALQELGRPLYEGVTEDLAVDAIGAESVEHRDMSYRVERAIAHEMREIAGDKAVERAYFQGDAAALHRRLNEQLGVGGLERLQQQVTHLVGSR